MEISNSVRTKTDPSRAQRTEKRILLTRYEREDRRCLVERQLEKTAAHKGRAKNRTRKTLVTYIASPSDSRYHDNHK